MQELREIFLYFSLIFADALFPLDICRLVVIYYMCSKCKYIAVRFLNTTEDTNMRIKKTAALFMAASLMAALSAGCINNNNKNNTSEEDIFPTLSNETVAPIGSTEIKGELGKEVTANNTSFTLRSLLVHTDSAAKERFIFFDIDLRNSTNKEYTLNTLNNFYIKLDDGTEVFSDVRSQLYANGNIKKDKYFVDPFNIPSNGQFSGIVGGFILKDDIDSFTVCFFPTGSNPNDKGTVIEYSITADDLKELDSTLLK